MLSAPPRLSPDLVATLPPYASDPTRFLSLVAGQGDVVSYRFGQEERVLVSDPAVVHEVLTAWPEESRWTPITRAAAPMLGDGLILAGAPSWRPRRLVVQRELTYRSVRRFAEAIVANTERALGTWLRGDGDLDLQAEIGRLTLLNLGDTVFGADFGAFADVLLSTLRASQVAIDAAMAGRFDETERQALDEATARLDAVVQRLVDDRTVEPTTAADLLSVLLEARESGDPVFAGSWLRDEAVMLITAGHETTAFTTTMALRTLAGEPETAQRLRSELAAAVARGVAPAQLADEVPLTRQVVQEPLRLYPPLPALHRTAVADTELGGHAIAAGTLVVVSPHVLQRDPRSWPEPERFDPDRFATERRRELPRHAYLPFGAGARICAGNHFALLESALIVALATLRLDLDARDGPPRLVDSGTALRCAGTVPVALRPAPAGAAPAGTGAAA
ncbi:cytochrome P450 [uncultured Friedmanniella sp.]|uniref:cytochrome P450 n=1 Tax=uncultured Friedmanniella sp. TaxID=335381 RepID=UPI0035C9F0EB